MGAHRVGLGLSLAAAFLQHPYAKRGRPAASSRQPSPTLQRLHPPFRQRRASRRATGHQNLDGAVKQPRPRPGRLGLLNTRAPARAPANPFARSRRRFHSSSCIPPKARFLWPGRLHPAFPGGSEGPNCTTTRTPHTQPPRPLHPCTQPHRSRSTTIASVALSPCCPPPRRPAAPLRPAALCSQRPGRPGPPSRRCEVPATPESCSLRNRRGAQGGD